MAPSTNEIREVIFEILESKLDVHMQDRNEDICKEPLTGEYFKLSAVDLTYLFFELEQYFGIRFHEKDIVGYGFNSINQITECILTGLDELEKK